MQKWFSVVVFRSGHIYQNERFDSAIAQHGTEIYKLRDIDVDTVDTSNMYDKVFTSTRGVTYSNKESEYAALEANAEYANTSNIYNTLSM